MTSSGTAFYNDNQFEKALDRYTKAAEVDGILNRHKALALYWAGRTAQFLAQISAKTRKEKAITKTQEAGPYEAAIVDVLRRIKESKIPHHFTDGHLQTFLKAHEEEEKIEKYAKQAIKNFCEAAELAKSDDFRQSFENVIPNDLFTLLRLYEQYATYEDVLDAYDKAYEVVQWTNQNQKGVLLHNWGHVYLAKRDFKQAIKKQEEALKLGGYSLANRANTYRSVGFLYNNLLTQSSNDKEANTQNAIDNFCMALELKLGDSTPALCLDVRSETFRYLLGLINNLPQSKNKIAAHERAFSIGEWTNSNQKVFMLIKWANTYLSVGSLELAIEKFQEARKELGCSPYERAFSLFSEAMVDGKIFERSNETNHAKNAINNCAKALDVQNSDGKLALYDGQILDILRKLSVLSAKIKKYDEAITIYEKVLLSHLWANQGEKGVAWQNWGMVYYNMGNFEKAIVKFKEAIDIYGNTNLNIASAYYSVGVAHSELGKQSVNLRTIQKHVVEEVNAYIKSLKTQPSRSRIILQKVSQIENGTLLQRIHTYVQNHKNLILDSSSYCDDKLRAIYEGEIDQLEEIANGDWLKELISNFKAASEADPITNNSSAK